MKMHDPQQRIDEAGAKTSVSSDLGSTDFVCLDDSLGRHPCRNTPACRRAVASLRSETVHALPPPTVSLTQAAKAAGVGAAGVFDLDLYKDFDHVMQVARMVTQKRGRISREIARAKRSGYYVHEFAFEQFIPDMVEIHKSKPIRDGRPIEADFYKRSVEELGGAPTGPIAIPPRPCPQHYVQYWGVFMRRDGHYQGAVRTDEQLVGYISLQRWGNSAWYMLVMGHGDHLRHGIMYLLHYELVARHLKIRATGPRYLIYYPFARRLEDASRHWKTLALFVPKYLRSVDEHRPHVPANGPVPDLVSGFYAVKQTGFDYWASSFPTAHDLGLSPHWLTFLHRAATIEHMRAPGLLVRLLAATRTLSPEILRALNPGLFPVEALERKRHVAALLYGQDWGLDVLAPLSQAGISQVDIGHPENAELCRLEGTYNSAWCYHRLAGSTSFFQQAEKADLVIVDHPAKGSETSAYSVWASLLRRTSREYLFGVNEAVMKGLECAPSDVISIQDRFQRLMRRSVILRGVFFRYRYPENSHWVWLDVPSA